ncbi:MAG: hypothetical protein AVDCRST_MAG18-4116 [uncultured Thermomicrobiales bacterium]|uniref:Uncharacterized protein n=1 Tax=uncultured Thermomicrobiales bacterium TaxID=1645740 RepID=A0A6J4VUT5_9BACT|nr:MAG: hypothetical protein AVDCRST_MAG18-4116 [uncultured Thermomicrobiales bacterium]
MERGGACFWATGLPQATKETADSEDKLISPGDQLVLVSAGRLQPRIAVVRVQDGLDGAPSRECRLWVVVHRIVHGIAPADRDGRSGGESHTAE